MVTETIEVKEQLVKRVVSSGNGGAVWVPRSWLGEEIVVIRPEKSENIKEKVMKVLLPNLPDVIAVFLYGSYARNEQQADSDIDVLVIAKHKFGVKKHRKIGVNVIELEKLKESIEKNPIMYFSMIREAKAIINSSLLEELKKIHVDYKNFKWFVGTTEDYIKSSREFIELDKLDGNYLTSYSVIYSIMLRLRGIFLIRCLIGKKDYSNKLFKKWLLKHNISALEYKTAYGIYRCVRDNKKVKSKIKISIAEDLLNILVREINILRVKIYG